MYWRDYTVGTNIAIAHYYSFQTITVSSAPKKFGCVAVKRGETSDFARVYIASFISWGPLYHFFLEGRCFPEHLLQTMST